MRPAASQYQESGRLGPGLDTVVPCPVLDQRGSECYSARIRQSGDLVVPQVLKESANMFILKNASKYKLVRNITYTTSILRKNHRNE